MGIWPRGIFSRNETIIVPTSHHEIIKCIVEMQDTKEEVRWRLKKYTAIKSILEDDLFFRISTWLGAQNIKLWE